MESFIFIVVIIGVYFIPTIAAHGKENSSGIALLNLFLGWTFLGWVGALIWAACAKPTHTD